MKHLIDFSQAPEGVKYLKDKTAPTTVVFKSKQNPNETIAVRICKRKDIKKVLKKSGPIYSTSVNFAGEPPLTKKPELTKFLGKPKNVY
jgi:L-threonylcarbamoyladenylate synthase